MRSQETISTVEVVIDGKPVLEVSRLDSSGEPRSIAAIADSLPASVRVKRDGVSRSFSVDRAGTAALVRRATDSRVRATARATAATIGAPVVAQALRNNCETAALQILLATVGMRVDQLKLQASLDRSGPLDPAGTEPDEVWGDPDDGYVGRADGTGPAGGFGVYPKPIARLAARYGRRLDDLTGSSITTVRRHILEGHAVMVWIGLDDGPYWSWRSPSGREIRVNLNEHTIVLVGVRRSGGFEAVNVLEGTREVLSPDELRKAWDLLGRRALTTT